LLGDQRDAPNVMEECLRGPGRLEHDGRLVEQQPNPTQQSVGRFSNARRNFEWGARSHLPAREVAHLAPGGRSAQADQREQIIAAQSAARRDAVAGRSVRQQGCRMASRDRAWRGLEHPPRVTAAIRTVLADVVTE